MPTVLQFRRGTTSQNNSFTGAAGEISIDSTLGLLRVHDGSTVGGLATMTNTTAAQTIYNKTFPVITGATVITGAITANVGTASTSTSTGAVIVTGGIGASGAVNAGANVTTTGSFVSTVTTGTPPIYISSTTLVTNLNADLVDGYNTATSNTVNTLVVRDSAGNVAVGNISLAAVSGIIPTSNASSNLGDSTHWFGTFYGVSTQAKYADLAEKYSSDERYYPGTVVIFGGNFEVTQSTTSHDHRIAGVVSTDPAYLMNADGPGVKVALTGRVPCRVQGPINKGDVLVSSNTPGVAQLIDNSKFIPGCVIGKALESINTNDIQTIEVVVGRF